MAYQERESKPLSERTADEIMKFIIDQDLQSGDKLPSEIELIKRFQVGRGTVREAVKVLTARNILTIRHGSGTFVAENFGIQHDPFRLALIRDKHKLVVDIFQIRLLIEPEIAAIAAQNATADDIAELEVLCCNVEKLLLEKKYHVVSDQKLHSKIAQCSKNSVVVYLSPLINTSIELFIDLTQSQLVQETVETHREILRAISSHDMLRARDAMTLHLMYNKRTLEQMIQTRFDEHTEEFPAR